MYTHINFSFSHFWNYPFDWSHLFNFNDYVIVNYLFNYSLHYLLNWGYYINISIYFCLNYLIIQLFNYLLFYNLFVKCLILNNWNIFQTIKWNHANILCFSFWDFSFWVIFWNIYMFCYFCNLWYVWLLHFINVLDIIVWSLQMNYALILSLGFKHWLCRYETLLNDYNFAPFH